MRLASKLAASPSLTAMTLCGDRDVAVVAIGGREMRHIISSDILELAALTIGLSLLAIGAGYALDFTGLTNLMAIA